MRRALPWIVAGGIAVLTIAWLALRLVDPLASVRQSHIDANVPEGASFVAFLARDLSSHFQAQADGQVQVTYELLRKEPTQSGVAFPKFYVWVVVKRSGSLWQTGAARVEAVDKRSFSVTRFISASEIRGDPDSVGAVFPAALVADVQRRARKAYEP
jgi:hypothetical protein